ncbi:MAG: bifunctional diaminohydroxyphosphoribosylaminopyrimidine deaminase/5-amino-6-(5-phosphoribosylamino)uracil reductase RibD [Trichlorobacter sp.]|uniref:bifunctional diaminohydroxyphosphoribosylaminopyrimidine deaminase/5-amino-6-(5-phosphoribosylamino)uracil reductase RibD n=1 Tax=Trichlorobacter sp. TaxID=2911007 RepID=UPI0025624A00|nr:bifunctional diaminohydroxyphosphoribosylaminopyrimidine deaminase/5-amino-6-(5-phosphoribosylamino)uracil reductase RibD [Trichlorobacter sp.]MDK9719061.1 bifunctional diaminohydroxyphosphoribosylaminopyrimidine deaminase/5-amino-6-(5-phosphoribosylamino)uracil reductase RibD [Trichlorobacter sp.]
MLKTDIAYMKRALSLARKGLGKTAPNPAVGCVIVRDGAIVGEGWHKKAGTPHAEIHALAMAGAAAKGADVYVTLEPCCHYGKTPPCCDALIAAGVRRVVAGMVDPFLQVAGNGLLKLRQAGIRVDVGLLEAHCKELNKGFIKAVTTGLPYLIYKTAMTMDGNIATVTGHSRWVTGEESRRLVHRLRSHCDAVMVGVGTVIVDNPQLTVRHVRGRDPLRVIVDTRLRTPESVNVLNDAHADKTVIATCEADPDIHQRYLLQGADILVCREYDGRVDMADLLHKLAVRGVQSILLEGGSRLAGDLLQHHLIDECIFFYAPKVVGNGFSPFAIQGISTMDEAIKLEVRRVGMSGPDMVAYARPVGVCSPA